MSSANLSFEGIFAHTPESLGHLMKTHAQPDFRAKQILEWVYREDAHTYAAMTNLPQALRERLGETLPLFQSTVVTHQESEDGTTKLLLQWPDGQTSECVSIPDKARRTACVSSQVGCPVECAFCASGIGGLQRQLSPAEIVEQAMRVRTLEGNKPRLSNVVFMGLGEPLANYDATLRALRIINAPWGMNIGARKITVSTVGLPTPMKRLADEGLQVTLALSLHAPTDELRQRLIPWAQRVSIDQLVDACQYYFDRTGREVTLEYILLDGVNDSVALANELATIAGKMRSNVNLLIYNPVDGLEFRRPTPGHVQEFHQALRRRGINAHVRTSRGTDIDAACGQLRRQAESKPISLSTPTQS